MPHPKTPGDVRKVLIVDDHAVFREGLVRILSAEKDLTVCGEVEDAAAALQKIAQTKPDLAIIDVSLEGTSGIDLTKQLRGRYPDLRILVLSMHKESLHAERALRAGANGYIMKREGGKKLLGAIRHVLRGQTYVSEEFKDHMLGNLSPRTGKDSVSPIERLSDRELEVFRLIGQGYGTRQMADTLHLSIKTIEFHRESIRAKLNLKNTFELVQHAIHWNFYERDSE
jgi:DNA-binding NarL/FixJ family response regulator